ncbi:MAG TPA: lysylphosphatidylglycerol synthase transmembrane domain-containing protein, partial [Terriglobales bacterium]|nr:lysylphosphatidylglycerol synthase transmembrane domain-containing protein [Terriglobales bacterium]
MNTGAARLRFAVGLVISLLLMLAAGRLLNWREIWHLLGHARLPLLALAVALLAADYLLRCLRWWLILRQSSSRASLRDCALVLLAGFGLNNVLPFRVGDVLRAAGFTSRLRAPASYLVGTLLLERALDLFSLLVVCLLVTLVSGANFPVAGMQSLLAPLTGLAVTALAAALLLAERVQALTIRLIEMTVRAPGRKARLERLTASLLRVFTSCTPAASIRFVLLSLVAWGLEAALFVSVSRSLGLRLPLAVPLLAFVAANFCTLIPSAPGYLGTFHAAAISVLVAAAVPRNSAAAFALLAHAALWLPVTVAGLVSFTVLHRRGHSSPARA